MFPIADDNTDRTTFPWVNYVLIAANIIVYVLFQGLGGNDAFTYAYAAVAREITTGIDITRPVVIVDALGNRGTIPLQDSPDPVYLTILSSMFMHGSIMHLLGNMLYLWIFGDNLEHRLGHIRYLLFYLTCGVVAALAQILSDPASFIPMLGASGAISGVLGGYLLIYPNRRVYIFTLGLLTAVPAYLTLVVWIGFQIAESLFKGSATGGVAYLAHIGGFIAGFILVKVFAVGTRASDFA